MKKLRKVGVWLLIVMLVLSIPGANVQANDNVVASIEATKESETSDEKKSEKAKSAETKKKESTEADKTTEKKESTEADKTTEEKESTEADKMTEKKETSDADKITEDKNSDEMEKTTEKKETSDTEKTTEKKETVDIEKSSETTEPGTGDKSEDNTEKSEDKTEQATTETGSEDKKETTESAQITKSVNSLQAEVKEEPEGQVQPKEYRIKIEPVEQGTDNIINSPTITVEGTTTPEDSSSWKKQYYYSPYHYILKDKNEDGAVWHYRFSITATDCYSFSNKYFTFIEDNEYFEVSKLTDGINVIHPEMKKIPESYHVTVKAVDENGEPIEDIIVDMKWGVGSYSTTVKEAEEDGTYNLPVRSNGDLVFYVFKITREGYTSYEGTRFCFDRRYYNQYFSVESIKQDFTITVRMESTETTLNNAKNNAITELNQYKNPADYRKAEQDEIATLIATWTEKINLSTTVDSVNWCLSQAEGKLDRLKTNIEYEDEEYRSRIYFLTTDGQKSYVNENGVVTLTNIEDGNFYITRPNGTLYANNEWDAKWRCVYEYEDLDHPGNIAFQVVVGTYGQFAGKFIGVYDATVTLSDLGRAVHFTVKVISGRVGELRAYVGGKDVSGKTITVAGSEKKTATIKGKLKGTERWISIPAYSIKYTVGGSTSISHATGEFRTWGTTGSVTYTLDADRSVSVTVNIKASIVHPTSVKVECPSRATVGDWNGAFNQYVGIMEGQGAGRYRVVVEPYNTSNPGVTWTDLTPDVATFQSLHALGIVPKKAGTAKFKVTCVDNPKISTEVKILFQYEKPLKTAKAEKSVYYAKPSDKSINLNIITNGQTDSSKGASEQRFYWSYSTSGVAKVTDSVHYDKSSVTIPNWFSHTISILGEGVVYVTGTPYDATENCQPVKFKVVVSADADKDRAAAERVEKIILSIGTVTLEKKSLIKHARSEFQALTSTQKGLVDDDVYAILVAAELELRRLERGDSDDGNGGGGENGDGGTGQYGNGTDSGGTGQESGGTGEESGGSQFGDPVGGGEGGSAGGTGDGTSTGESGSGNETSSDNGAQDVADAIARNARARRKSNMQTKVQAATNNSSSSSSSGKKVGAKGAKGKGKKFYEIDIQDIPKEVVEIVENISPETKAAVTFCILIAFVYGFMRRRRQHLDEEKDQ